MFLAIWTRFRARDEGQVEADAQAFEESIRMIMVGPRREDAQSTRRKRQFLKQFFGENGVFEPTEAVMKTKLMGDTQKEADRLKARGDEAAKGAAAKPLPARHAVVEAKAADAKINVRGNPAKLGDSAASLSARLGRRESDAVHAGQRPARTGRGHRLAVTIR